MSSPPRRMMPGQSTRSANLPRNMAATRMKGVVMLTTSQGIFSVATV